LSDVNARAIRTVSINTTILLTDYTVLVDATSGNLIITLPTAVSASGYAFNIKKIDSSVNTVMLDGNGVEVIDGTLTKIISNQYSSITVQSNGTGWYII
jgi:hypothetical protein